MSWIVDEPGPIAGVGSGKSNGPTRIPSTESVSNLSASKEKSQTTPPSAHAISTEHPPCRGPSGALALPVPLLAMLLLLLCCFKVGRAAAQQRMVLRSDPFAA
jgi:hypothetical protein